MAIDIPEESRRFINEGFAERLENNSPDTVDVVIEAERGRVEDVLSQVRPDGGVELFEDRISGGRFIPARVRVDDVPRVADIDGVALVHQDQLMGIGGLGAVLPGMRPPNPANAPPRVWAEDAIMQAFERDDPFAGQVGIGRIEQPRFNLLPTPFGDPLQAALSVTDHYTDADVYGTDFINTFDSVGYTLDTGLTDGAAGARTQVAVLDTGHTPNPLSSGDRPVHRESQVPGEPAVDMNGHGSWCTNTVAGQRHPSPWGPCHGVAEQSVHAHFKCLNTLPGVGFTSWILQSVDRALEWGADVINMSLGGAQQGPIDEDPYCRFIRDNCKENAGDREGAIFVAAAGNAGPLDWTVGSPAVCDKAIAVGAMSMTDGAPSWFSSRGPQGEWYFEHPDRYEEDRREYGDMEFLKPDCIAPGGGRMTEALADDKDEVLWQAEVGWMEGSQDGIRDGTGGMMGSSMAAPHVAGLVTRLYDADIIQTAREFKSVMEANGDSPSYPEADEWADEQEGGKNLAAGWGPARESTFTPE